MRRASPRGGSRCTNTVTTEWGGLAATSLSGVRSAGGESDRLGDAPVRVGARTRSRGAADGAAAVELVRSSGSRARALPGAARRPDGGGADLLRVPVLLSAGGPRVRGARIRRVVQRPGEAVADRRDQLVAARCVRGAAGGPDRAGPRRRRGHLPGRAAVRRARVGVER